MKQEILALPKKPTTLRPHDVAVALQLVLTPEVTFAALAKAVGLSLGESHNSVRRLQHAKLVSSVRRRTVVPALRDFLIFGVPYAFPADVGPETRGVPTAHSAPPLAERISSADAVVWPSERGNMRGRGLLPLCSSAALLAESNPELYHLLALVDAIRIGRARERNLAKDLLNNALCTSTP